MGVYDWIADWAVVLRDFLVALGIEHAHVLGLSWGGMLAQELYRLDAARIDSLFLADTYAGWKGSIGADAAKQRLERCVLPDNRCPDAAAVGRTGPA